MSCRFKILFSLFCHYCYPIIVHNKKNLYRIDYYQSPPSIVFGNQLEMLILEQIYWKLIILNRETLARTKTSAKNLRRVGVPRWTQFIMHSIKASCSPYNTLKPLHLRSKLRREQHVPTYQLLLSSPTLLLRDQPPPHKARNFS